MGKQQDIDIKLRGDNTNNSTSIDIPLRGNGNSQDIDIPLRGDNPGPSKDKPTGESLYGFDKVFGENISYLEKAYDQGHLTPEAFGKTDPQSIKAWEPFNKAMESEAAIIKELNGLDKIKDKGFTSQDEVDKFNNKITEIYGTEVAQTDADGNPVLDENNKPVMVMKGGTLEKARNNSFTEWGKIESNYHHDPQNIVADNYGIVYNEIDKSWDIQTGKQFTQNYQGVISLKDKDVRSNDALQLGQGNNPAYDDLMSIDANRTKARNQYKTSAIAVTDNFTERALSKLKSENADERHAAHAWINDVVNTIGAKDENTKRIFIDQLKGIGPNTFKYQTSMWAGNAKMILDQFNKLDGNEKAMLLENAKENKYQIFEDQEYYPASSNKTSAEYKNDLLVGEELNKWDAQLDENMVRLREQALQIAKDKNGGVSKFFDNLVANQTHIFDPSGQRGTLKKVENFVYEAAFTDEGRQRSFEDWFNLIANKNYTTTREITGTWGGLGWEDSKTVTSETALEQMQLGAGGAKNFTAFKKANEKNMANARAASGGRVNYDKEAELKKLYNAISQSYKAQYDDLKFDNIYTENAVYGGLGNNSSNSMTTIGLDGTIDFVSKALVNTGTVSSNPNLLSKQRNFSKVMGVMSGGGKWTNGSEDFAVVNDYTHNMSMNEFRLASKTSGDKLDKFFAEGKDLDNLQMTYIKYTSLPGHSMYRFYNPADKSTIYANIKDTKLKEIKEDNYTYSRTNWIQQTFNLDGKLPLTNRTDQEGNKIFTKTPELVNIGGVYNVRYSYYDDVGDTKTNNIQIGSMSAMSVELAQERAAEFLDARQKELIQP